MHALQRLVADDNQPLTRVLREAKLISAKLRLEDVEHWVSYELSGYPAESDPPAYRAFSPSCVEIRNPVSGWSFAGHFSQRIKAHEPIAEIERLSKGGQLTMSLHQNFKVSDGLGGALGSNWPQRLVIDAGQYVNIVDAVRNELLQWTVELEKRGIVGENMSFDEKEKSSAIHQFFNIQKFTGVFGNVTNSQVTLHDYSSIHQVLKSTQVPQDQRNELENIMDELKSANADQKKTLLDRGKAWLIRNKDLLGSVAEIVSKTLGFAGS